MNSSVRLILEAVSVFIACAMLVWLVTLLNNSTETNNTALNNSDLTTYEITKDSDFVDYTEKKECINEDCDNPLECNDSSHTKARYYTKFITGSEVLRLVAKYDELVQRVIIVRTDKTTRSYDRTYKFIKNMPNNLDYINPDATFKAKVILQNNQPHTMYFSQQGKMFYKENDVVKEKDIEELMFKKGGHNYSNFIMFTESGTYTFPADSNVSKITIYACASGLGTKAGQAIAGEEIKAIRLWQRDTFKDCTIKVDITYEGCTEITVHAPNRYEDCSYVLRAGEFDKSIFTDPQATERAKQILGAYQTGCDGEKGKDGYSYEVTLENDKTIVITGAKASTGGEGGQGGLYGFGGAGGNGGYIVKYEDGVVNFKSYTSNGGSGGTIGYDDDNLDLKTKLLPSMILGYGGRRDKRGEDFIVFDSNGNPKEGNWYTRANVRISTEECNGGNGTMYFGGYGGSSPILDISENRADETRGTIWNMFNGAGGGAGGYGAGGGAAGGGVGGGSYNLNLSNENGEPSGGMVYLQFN